MVSSLINGSFVVFGTTLIFDLDILLKNHMVRNNVKPHKVARKSGSGRLKILNHRGAAETGSMCPTLQPLCLRGTSYVITSSLIPG